MMKTIGRGANIRNLSQGILSEISIPLPPLEIQKKIAERIETEREIVDGCRKLANVYEDVIRRTVEKIWE